MKSDQRPAALSAGSGLFFIAVIRFLLLKTAIFARALFCKGSYEFCLYQKLTDGF
jgi:hypothetical protein